jgi:hypothetical protein
MSAFNHMGKLVKVEGEWALYNYYPDYYSQAATFGSFKVRPASLVSGAEVEYVLTDRLGCEERGFNRPDEQVVLALIRKIKASVVTHGALPEKIFHNG